MRIACTRNHQPSSALKTLNLAPTTPTQQQEAIPRNTRLLTLERLLPPSGINSKPSMKGIVVELPSHVAEELRHRPPRRGHSETQEDAVWKDVIPVSPDFASGLHPAATENDAESVAESDDELSYSPPESLPQLVVYLDKLVGYAPSTREETEALSEQVRSALWGADENYCDQENDENNHESNSNRNSQPTVLDWEDRVQKLFDTQVLRHGDTSVEFETSETILFDETEKERPMQQPNTNLNHSAVVQLDYPELLYRSSDGRVVTTARIWKTILQRPKVAADCPALNTLLDHLQNCQRSLLWKHAMHEEISLLVETEEGARQDRRHSEALQTWSGGKRHSKLQDLYAVRETFVHRLELAQEKCQKLQAEWDLQVQAEWQRLGLVDSDYSDLFGRAEEDEGDYFPPDDEYLFSSDNDMDDDDDNGSSVSSKFSEGGDQPKSHAEDTLLDSDKPVPQEALPESDGCGSNGVLLDVNDVGEESNAKEQLIGEVDIDQDYLEPTVDVVDEAQELVDEDHKTKLKEQIRERKMTTELKMAMAGVTVLEEKLAHVDELLETLQEEEWADEEEAEENGGALFPAERRATGADNKEFGLLDQILAMILGSTPPKEGADVSDHVQYLEQEHLGIISGWKEYFGRLPASKTTGSLSIEKSDEVTKAPIATAVDPQLQREALGLEENFESNWDEDEPAKEVDTEAPQEVAIRKIAFRPGGHCG